MLPSLLTEVTEQAFRGAQEGIVGPSSPDDTSRGNVGYLGSAQNSSISP